jgi:UDP-3-O-[3-hydroxymyristoyl] glucosamine N-acyltransferase
MHKTLEEIAREIKGQVVGNKDTIITGVCGIKEAQEGDITFVANLRYLPLINSTKASAIITSCEVRQASRPIIRTSDPSLAFAKVASMFMPADIRHPQGVHPTVILGKGVKLGSDVGIGAYVVIGDNVLIGEGTKVWSGCFIGDDTSIGNNSLLYPNVTIRERINIGRGVIIHSGTVIGSDGFGFVFIENRHQKIPQIGTVDIGDDVEIGANVTIDRARFGKTVVGTGTKIDNLVQIAHNVVIGENSIIVAQVGISGSTTIGRNVTLAGQAGVVGHINIADNATVAAQSGVSKSIPAGQTVWGYPAKPFHQAKRINASVQRLPQLYKTIAELKKRVTELEARINAEKR